MAGPETDFIPSDPGSLPRYRKRALAILLGFVILSLAIHAFLGPTATAVSPMFRVPDTPDQAVSVVTLSRGKLAIVKPTPTPTPPPKIFRRTIANLAPLKYLEFGLRALRHAIKPPARRTAMLAVHPEVDPSPTQGPDASAATDQIPTRKPASGLSAQADTGADKNRVSGTVVWGDDNPPRLIAMSGVSSSASASGRHVRLEVEVSPEGEVLAVRIISSSGDPTVDAAAVDAARKASYKPATLNGLPVDGTCTIDFPPQNATTT